MTDEELAAVLRWRGSALQEGAFFAAADRIEALTAERDAAYARGYSDAETEISKSALGQSNDFLHSQYANAADRVRELTAERDKYESAWMTAEGKLADAESDIAHLHKLLAEAASDLTAYVDAEYPPDTCDRYPDIANRRERDMDLVRRIQAELKGETP